MTFVGTKSVGTNSVGTNSVGTNRIGAILTRLVCLVLATWMLPGFVVEPALANDMMYYKLWSSSEGRQAYEVQLFKTAMELTASDYPPYVLTQYNFQFGSHRGRREVAVGNKVNFYVAPPRKPGDDLYNEVVAIPVPIMKGLLGYRKLLVDVESVETFSKIKTLDELKKFKVGQGRGWPDVRVYKHAGFSIDDSAQFNDLFDMLDQGRFDFLPLGIMEADKALATLGRGNKSLTTIDSLFIYYPLPAVFQIRAEEKLLIERLQLGLQRAIESGRLDELFYAHFADALSALAKEDYQLIVLDNPHLESAMGLGAPQLSQRFLSEGTQSELNLSEPNQLEEVSGSPVKGPAVSGSPAED